VGECRDVEFDLTGTLLIGNLGKWSELSVASIVDQHIDWNVFPLQLIKKKLRGHVAGKVEGKRPGHNAELLL